jgi:hypothetical protein
MIVGDTGLRSGIEAIADLMASITARDGVLVVRFNEFERIG